MKLWLLRPAAPRPACDYGEDPWVPWFDKAFGFVIRAENETDARQIAHKNAGDENRNSRQKTTSPWLDPVYSTCIELTANGDARLILKDYKRA